MAFKLLFLFNSGGSLSQKISKQKEPFEEEVSCLTILQKTILK